MKKDIMLVPIETEEAENFLVNNDIKQEESL